MTAARLSPRGLAAGIAAFTIWGLFPLYLHGLRSVPEPGFPDVLARSTAAGRKPEITSAG